MTRHQQLLTLLDQWGLRDLLIPFAIIFALVFALLQSMKIFKKGGTGTDKDEANRRINAVIAIGVALAALIPHYTGRGFDIILFMNVFLPHSFLLLFVVLLFLALVGSVSDIKKPKEHPFVGIIAIVAVIALVFIVLQSTQQVNYQFLYFLNDPNMQALAIVVLVFGLVIWYIARKETPPTAGTPAAYFTNFKKTLEKLFGS